MYTGRQYLFRAPLLIKDAMPCNVFAIGSSVLFNSILLWCGTSTSHRYFVTNNFEAEKIYQILIPLEKMLLLDKGTNALDRFSIG